MSRIILVHLIVFLKVLLPCRSQGCGSIQSLESLERHNVTVPWVVTLTNQKPISWIENAIVYPGFLVSPNLVFLSARLFYRESNKQWNITIFNSPSVYVAEFINNVKINVSHISLHNEKANSTECQYSSFKFALAHLSKPVQFNETIQPICVDGFNTKAELTDTNSYDPGRFYRLEWSRDSRKKVLEYFVRRINISSQESCISKSKNDLTTPFLEALECVDTSDNYSTQRIGVDWNSWIPDSNSPSFYCKQNTCFLHGTMVKFLTSCVTKSFVEPDTFYVWPLNKNIPGWIGKNELCGVDNFTCILDGTCLGMSKLCDGIPDCTDYSDENVHYCENPKQCLKDEFRCKFYGKCIPKTKQGDGTRDCFDGEDEEDSKRKVILWVSVTCTFLIVLITCGSVYFYFWIQRLKKNIRDLTDEEISEFFNGRLHDNSLIGDISENQHNEYDFPLYINSSHMYKPWDDIFEISPNYLQLGDVLGQGEFGIVYKGNLEHVNQSNRVITSLEVAVKTQLPTMGVEDFKNLLREVKIISHVGSHDCIVSFIGASTQSIKKRQVHLVMEYCSNGNLLNNLKSIKKKLYLKDFNCPNSSSIKNKTALSETTLESDFLKWSVQIARGMAYLENRNVIHGDLAARNILLTCGMNAKISDFGLSRELHDTNIYVKSTQQPIPWKWLAVESFDSHIFSYKTDVWAYGVTLWEIFSLGDNPYGDIPCTPEFVIRLQRGYRLPCPQLASTEIYDIMLNTWNEDAEKRPSFSHLGASFAQLQGNSYDE